MFVLVAAEYAASLFQNREHSHAEGWYVSLFACCCMDTSSKSSIVNQKHNHTKAIWHSYWDSHRPYPIGWAKATDQMPVSSHSESLKKTLQAAHKVYSTSTAELWQIGENSPLKVISTIQTLSSYACKPLLSSVIAKNREHCQQRPPPPFLSSLVFFLTITVVKATHDLIFSQTLPWLINWTQIVVIACFSQQQH